MSARPFPACTGRHRRPRRCGQLASTWPTTTSFLARMGLRGFADDAPKHLSGGIQQRVAIARAPANDPKSLLVAEPFGALDNQTRLLMQELLLDTWEAARKTVLFVTHDIDEAIFMANRVVVYSARPGRIKCEVATDLPHNSHYTNK